MSESPIAAVLRMVLVAVGHDPTMWVPAWWKGAEAEAHVARWVAMLGADRVVEVARATRLEHPAKPDGPKALDRAMERAARATRPARASRPRSGGATAEGGSALPPGVSDAVDLFGRAIAAGEFVPPSAVTPRQAREMLARGLVTHEQLRQMGIAA